MDPSQVLGVVLVGGASSRMGSPKESLCWSRSGTLFECVHRALNPVVREVVLSGHGVPGASERRIPDDVPGGGPLVALAAVLRFVGSDAASEGVRAVLVCPCDMPCLTADLLMRLRDHGSAPVAVLQSRERVHSLPIRVAVSALPQVEEVIAAGRHALFALLDAVQCDRVPVSDDEHHLLRNINRPEDLPAGTS